jgi:hypothetical protein
MADQLTSNPLIGRASGAGQHRQNLFRAGIGYGDAGIGKAASAVLEEYSTKR